MYKSGINYHCDGFNTVSFVFNVIQYTEQQHISQNNQKDTQGMQRPKYYWMTSVNPGDSQCPIEIKYGYEYLAREEIHANDVLQRI
jgi:hypothetical protein